ncbi:MAG: hypothetical protein C0613_12670 [Desulfobulbaceae bacterium]|nr:MAG: hypothetical protein C0613_12670 [Desulfobulbaceae bacterium]
MDYLQPPLLQNSDGEPRRVGFELEFGGLTIREIAAALHKHLGGELRQHNPYHFEINDSSLGDLQVERDAQLLKSVKYRDLLDLLKIDFNPDTMANEIEHGIDRLSSLIIPCEIVTQPLNFADFAKLNDIVELLNQMHAKGTQETFFYAFGLHINPAAPDLTSTTLLNYLRAFLLLTDWIIEESAIDFSRRFLTNYINPFPRAYVDKVLASHYRPEISQLIDDYLRYNPTRNRALDMLPLFCLLDRDRVEAGINKEERSLLGCRPAFHYRLPDCRLGDRHWSIAAEWNRWWHVEVLAAKAVLLDELLDLWHQHRRNSMFQNKKEWTGTVRAFLENHINAQADPPWMNVP